MKADQALPRVDDLIGRGELILSDYAASQRSKSLYIVDEDAFAGWQTQTLTFLTSLLGADHTYTAKFADVEDGYPSEVKTGLGILRALREDLANGYLFDFRTLVSAEIFTDFLEMAEHLLDTGYKDPAASLIGAVLEDGMRQMCIKRDIKVGKSDLVSLNTKLADANAYNRLMQKRIAVWTDLRNHADHGEFDQYTADNVREMLGGVTDFLSAELS